MLRFIILIAIVSGFFSSCLFADKAPALNESYALDEVANNVYVIHGPKDLPNPENQGFMNNPSFIVGDGGVVVVDPGASVQVGEMLMHRIEETTDKPVVAVFNTHIHGDHWLGNQAIIERYPDAIIYAHEQMLKQAQDGQGEYWLDLMNRLTKGATEGTRVVMPTEVVDGGDVIKAAGLEFSVIHDGKAHTDTDIMILVKQLGLVYLGDNCGNERILRIDNGSFRGNISALNKALGLGASVFVPGHGVTGGSDIVTSYRDYLSTLYETVAEAYEEGKADFEVRPMLLPKLSKWSNWSRFEQEMGTNINAAYLEVEEADFE